MRSAPVRRAGVLQSAAFARCPWPAASTLLPSNPACPVLRLTRTPKPNGDRTRLACCFPRPRGKPVWREIVRLFRTLGRATDLDTRAHPATPGGGCAPQRRNRLKSLSENSEGGARPSRAQQGGNVGQGGLFGRVRRIHTAAPGDGRTPSQSSTAFQAIIQTASKATARNRRSNAIYCPDAWRNSGCVCWRILVMRDRSSPPR